MKIEIEKVQKIKPFEPFILKIQFDSIEEARSLHNEFGELIDIGTDSSEIKLVHDCIHNEMVSQGYLTNTKKSPYKTRVQNA